MTNSHPSPVSFRFNLKKVLSYNEVILTKDSFSTKDFFSTRVSIRVTNRVFSPVLVYMSWLISGFHGRTNADKALHCWLLLQRPIQDLKSESNQHFDYLYTMRRQKILTLPFLVFKMWFNEMTNIISMLSPHS